MSYLVCRGKTLLNKIALKEIVANPEIDKKDKALACLAYDAHAPKQVKAVKEIAASVGLKGAKKINFLSILARHTGKTIRSPEGWELTSDGRAYVKQLGGGPTVQLSSSLRTLASKISSKNTQAFVEEAIECFEAHNYRAAVVLSWVGAVSVLYDHVVSNYLSEFNAAALKQDPKWKPAKTKDDLARMKEANFLVICESASIIGKSVKQELEGCLTFRNGCGHPNSLRIGENRVSGHIETLVFNVYSVF
ncbi:conserved hypothetical protein [Halomonas sp. A3H3]|uniref:Uncharacterized protein n=1 Tax=Vreelandella titanicae TaxID=664683 RepID=A0AAP9NMQ0_9GAMM|nr:hypothetical protein FX987_02758 [Halomonas titanicae]CDG53893.1 conserved hypothetical protein [Halomonas sp. A3H3]SDJ26530.1 hypothetical protein SAMN04487867_13051 [Halomonas titanicae]|tara:strand:- start:348 stop:1094 length:747 start_codon:yes stop_codon:yes gene_type:complete